MHRENSPLNDELSHFCDSLLRVVSFGAKLQLIVEAPENIEKSSQAAFDLLTLLNPSLVKIEVCH